MLTILDTAWSDLLRSEMIGVKIHALKVHSSFVMILKTKGEFCINDIGYVTERIPVEVPKEKEQEYLKSIKEMGLQLYGKDSFDEAARFELEHKNSYIDNFALYPI